LPVFQNNLNMGTAGHPANKNQYASRFEFAETMVFFQARSDLIEITEGYLHHKWGVASLLPQTHKYRYTPPDC
jgi:hypothetical protein